MKIALVVEGHGDQLAVPTLVAKTAEQAGLQIYAPNPIRAGTAVKLSIPGQLERYLELAASRPDCDFVLVVVDHDDGCAKETYKNFVKRAAPYIKRHSKQIRFCFCVREYETWFLEASDQLALDAPDYEWFENSAVYDPPSIRGAKEKLQSLIGKRYREVIDQLTLTRKLNLTSLYIKSRSYRKFVKEVTGLSYAVLNDQFLGR